MNSTNKEIDASINTRLLDAAESDIIEKDEEIKALRRLVDSLRQLYVEKDLGIHSERKRSLSHIVSCGNTTTTCSPMNLENKQSHKYVNFSTNPSPLSASSLIMRSQSDDSNSSTETLLVPDNDEQIVAARYLFPTSSLLQAPSKNDSISATENDVSSNALFVKLAKKMQIVDAKIDQERAWKQEMREMERLAEQMNLITSHAVGSIKDENNKSGAGNGNNAYVYGSELFDLEYESSDDSYSTEDCE
jgi:hypothetical protein